MKIFLEIVHMANSKIITNQKCLKFAILLQIIGRPSVVLHAQRNSNQILDSWNWFVIVSGLQIIEWDHSVCWGSYKVLRFGHISDACNPVSISDLYLFQKLKIKSSPNLDCSVSWWGAVFHCLFICINTETRIIGFLLERFIRVNYVNACNHVLVAFVGNTTGWIFPDWFLSWLDVVKMFLFHGG